MDETVASPQRQMVLDKFAALMGLENQAWDECMPSLLKIAEKGINAVAPGLTASQKEELQDLAVITLYKTLLNKQCPPMKDGIHLANRLELIAQRKTKDLIKSHSFKKTGSLQVFEEDDEAKYPVKILKELTNLETASDSLLHNEMYAQLNQALDLVGEPCKTVLVNIVIEELSYKEFANMFHINNVDYQMRKCKKALKIIFEKISSDNSYAEKEELDL